MSLLNILVYVLITMIMGYIIDSLSRYHGSYRNTRIIRTLKDELILFSKIRKQETVKVSRDEIFFPDFSKIGLTFFYPLFILVAIVIISYSSYYMIGNSVGLDKIYAYILIIFAYLVVFAAVYIIYFKSFVIRILDDRFGYARLIEYILLRRLRYIKIDSIDKVKMTLIRDHRASNINRFYQFSLNATGHNIFAFSTIQFESKTAIRFISALKENHKISN